MMFLSMKYLHSCILSLFVFYTSSVQSVGTCSIGCFYWRILAGFADKLLKYQKVENIEEIKKISTNIIAKHTFCFPENCQLTGSENERDVQEVSKFFEPFSRSVRRSVRRSERFVSLCAIGSLYSQIKSGSTDSFLKDLTEEKIEEIKQIASRIMAKHTFCLPENCQLTGSENERDNQEITRVSEIARAENLLKR